MPTVTASGALLVPCFSRHEILVGDSARVHGWMNFQQPCERSPKVFKAVHGIPYVYHCPVSAHAQNRARALSQFRPARAVLLAWAGTGRPTAMAHGRF